MEFFALNREQDELLKELRVRIRRLQSGGTLDSIAGVGGDIRNQIGASFLSLKNLAQQYKKDDKIATILWNSGQREEQIVACFLFTEQLNREKITQLLPRAKNEEVVEYLGSLFLSKHPSLPEIAQELGHSDDPQIQLLIISACAKHRQLYKADAMIDKSFFDILVNKHYTNSYVEYVANRYRL